MRRAILRQTTGLATLLAAAVLAGCGDSAVTGLDEGFDAGVSASLVEAAASSEWVNLTTGHAGLVVLAVNSSRAATNVVPGLDEDRAGAAGQRAGLSVGEKLSRAVSASASFSSTGRNGILPDEVLGKTYTLAGQTAGGYRVDEEVTDAPQDGARFHMYELDHVTGRPKLIPISRAGTLDLMEPIPNDELHVLATDKGGNVLSDLVMDRSVVDDGVTRETTFTSSGTLIKSNPFDYTLLDFVSIGAGFTSVSFEFDRDLRSEERDIRVRFDSDGVLNYSESGVSGVVTLLMIIESGGHTIAVDVTDDGTFATGSVSYDGEIVVNISGDNVVPDFTHPDGTLLEGAALDDMWDLWFAYDLMLFFGDELLIPLSTLML